MRLINLVKPVPLESMLSRLDRLGAANFYEEASWFRPLLSPPARPNPNTIRDMEQYRELGDLTGLSREDLYGLVLHRFVSHYYLPEQVPESAPGELDAPLWPQDTARQGAPRDYLLTATDTRVCPECYQDTGAILLPWSLRFVTTCPLHKVLLVDHCESCKEPLRFANGREGVPGLCAACRADVRTFHAYSIAGHSLSLELTDLIWSAIGLGSAVSVTPTGSALVDPGVANPAAFPAVGLPMAADNPLHAMHTATLFDFLRRMPSLILSQDPQSPIFDPRETLPGGLQGEWTGAPRHIELKWQASVPVMHSTLVAMWRLLRDWPQTWHETLARIAHLESGKRNAGQRFPQCLAEEFPGSRWEWLTKGVESYLAKEALNNSDLYPWLGYYRAAQRQPSTTLTPLLTQTEAARTMGVSASRIQEFIARGQLSATPSPGTGSRREWALVDARSIQALHATRVSHFTLAQAATYVGVSEESVLSLIEAGLLAAEGGPGMNESSIWTFDVEALDASLEAILGAVPVRQMSDEGSGPDELSLSDARRIVSWQGVKLPDLLGEVESGALQAYRDIEAAGLRQVWFERGTVLSWLSHRKQPEGRELLTAEQVRELLSCKPETLRRLGETGLLVPVEEKQVGKQTHTRYDAADVEAFRARYVTTEGASEILRVTQLTVQRWTRDGRVSAVSGPEIDGAHVYRYDRSELEAWRYDRLTFGEAMQALGVSKATLHRWVETGKITPLDDMGGKQRWFARADVESVVK
jgi:DNA-binding transcriptional MerR regulator